MLAAQTDIKWARIVEAAVADDRRGDAARSDRSLSGIDPHAAGHRWLGPLLESVQDIIIVGLCLVLFLIMARALWDLGSGAVNPHVDVRGLLSQVLFVTVLVELYRLLIIYLREHRVAIDAVVEIALVTSLREVILTGVTALAWERLLAITAFVVALGTLLRFASLQVSGGRDTAYTGIVRWPWSSRGGSAPARMQRKGEKSHDMD